MTWWRDKAEFEKRWEAAGWSIAEMARAEQADRVSLNKWKFRHGLDHPPHISPHSNRPVKPVQPPLVPIIDEQLTIAGDVGVSSDWHAPMIHYDTLHRMLDDLSVRGLKRLIVAGDLTNQDALAGHEHQQQGAELGPEMEHLHYAVDQALDCVDELIVSVGNHDRHAMLKLKVDFDRSLRMLLAGLAPEKLDRITVTARDSVIVDTMRGPWLVCHTRSYSRQPLAYPNRLALRHGMHIAGGHRHHYAIGRAANGKDIVELGGLMDFERMAYVHRYTNDLPLMQRGYGLLVDGRMRLPML